MSTRRQLNFASGEVSPAFAARTDSEKWFSGLRTLRNCYPMKSGGLQNRGGFQFVGPSRGARLIPFVNSNDNPFVLEMCDGFIRAVSNGEFVKNDQAVIVGATQANPCVLTVLHPAGHGYTFINNTATTMTLTGGATWAVGETGLTITASAAYFKSRNVGVGNVIKLANSTTGDFAYFQITAFTSSTVVTVTTMGISSGSTVATTLRSTAITNWARINVGIFQVQSHITVSGVSGMTELNGNTYALTAIGATVHPHANGNGYVVMYSLETTGGSAINSTGYTAFNTTNGYGLATRNRTITGITRANPAVVTLAGHSLEDGQEVLIEDIVGMTELNGRHFKVSNSTDDTFELQDLSGANINSSSYTAYSSAGTAYRILELKGMDLLNVSVSSISYTHYPIAGIDSDDADEVTYCHRSNRSIVIAHEDYAPINIEYQSLKTNIVSGAFGFGNDTDTAHEFLILQLWTDQPLSASFMNVGVADIGSFSCSGGAGAVASYYRIAPFSAEGEEGLYLSATSANTATDANRVTLDISGITARNQVGYNVYKSYNNQAFGWIGTAFGATLASFIDNGITPDFTRAPSEAIFDTEHLPGSRLNFGCVGAYQGRVFFGRRLSARDIILGSQSNFPWNFLTETPSNDGSGVALKLFGVTSSKIKHLVGHGRFFVLTDGTEVVIDGNEAGIITPTAFAPRVVGGTGASSVSPALMVGNIAFVHASGSVIRLLSIEQPDRGSIDSTVFSSHLFLGKTITELAWQSFPNSILWAERSDGKLLGMNHMPEYGVMGWHRHDTDGTFESICVVQESSESVLYAIVERTINGTATKYIEKMVDRHDLSDIEDATFMDSFLSYNGENSNTSHTMTLSGGSTWASGETGLTLTSSASYFTAADIGNAIVIQNSAGQRVKCTITGYTGATVVTVTAEGFSNDPEVSPLTSFTTVPANLRSTAVSTWGKAVDEVSGLWHLEGENVTVFGDGNVVHNPNRSDLSTKTVASGAITLASTYVKIHVGLPYISDVETLELDTPNRAKLMGKVTVQCEYTRGLYAGRALPADSSPISNLQPMNLYDTEITTRTPLTGRKEVVITSQWDFFGRVALRQVDPLPMTILSILPEGLYPPKG